jgi:hypothetical protein
MVKVLQASKIVLLTTAVGCDTSNLSQLSAADGRSELHMDWDFEYLQPAHMS